MKTKSYIFLLLIQLFFITYTVCQENYTIQECNNFNSFTENETTYPQLQEYIDDITPSKTIHFDIGEVEGLELSSIYSLLNVDEGTTFELKRETPSLYDSITFFHRYQQYHDGVRVDGGGFIEERIIIDGPPGPGCNSLPRLMVPFISSDININTTPTVSEESIPTILNGGTIHKRELQIVSNLLEDCTYHLIWWIHYSNESTSEVAIIDAHTGIILETRPLGMSLRAPIITSTYSDPGDPGFVQLADDQLDGTFGLKTVDGSVTVHDLMDKDCDFESFPDPDDPNDPDHPIEPYDDMTIPFATPTSISSGTWGAESVPHVYQTFFVGPVVKEEVNVLLDESLITKISKLHIGACSGDGGTAFPEYSSLGGHSYIRVGFDGTTTNATYDVVAHELGHIILGDLAGDPSGRTIQFKALHEGFSDILGTYIEYKLQGNFDWIINDDAGANYRDLSNIDCNHHSSTIAHTRGLILGNWFYLLVNGSPFGGTTSTNNSYGAFSDVDVKIVMDILMEAKLVHRVLV